MAAKQSKTVVVKSAGFSPAQISKMQELPAPPETPTLTPEFVLEALKDFGKTITQNITRSLDSFDLLFKKVTLRDTELQSLNNIELLNGEEKVEDIIQIKVIVESDIEDFQNEENSLKDFNVYKKDKLREITPESLTQQQQYGKLPRNVGVFKLRSKIRNGTLQFFYKNGLFNLIKENFPVRREQHCELLLIQLKSQEFGQFKKGGRFGFKKKVRKKARRKWKWRKK